MVKNIKSTKELEQLIQQAKSNNIPWDTEIKLESNIKIIRPIQEVPLENWNKVRHIGPAWEELIDQIKQSNELFNDDWKFSSKEILEGFKKCVDTDSYPTLGTSNRGAVKINEVNENDVITTSWNDIREMLESSQIIHGRNNDNCAFQSENALRFLQLVISDEFLQTIEYQKGEKFKLGELKTTTRKAQEWLESQEDYNEKGKREKIKELDISNKNLEGNLDLNDFVGLKVLSCQKNKLTGLDISKLTNLKELYCSENKLAEIKFGKTNNLEYLDARINYLSNINSLLDNLDPKKLKALRIGDNNFAESDLTPFNKFTNLEFLSIFSNYWQQEVYNRFHGSLEPLKSLTKLRQLEINNTNIDNGIKFLPDSLEELYCANEQSPEAKVGEIYNQLRDYGEEGNYDLRGWKGDNTGVEVQTWLNENYPENKRAKITYLDISNQELKGGLDLKDFIKLERLDCSSNYLESLINLSNCKNLTNISCSSNRLTDLDLSRIRGLRELDCSDNKFSNIDFLDKMPDETKTKLNKLRINKNNFEKCGLKKLSPFTNLVELNVGNCPFEGNLGPLKDMERLEKIYINHTNIEEGLEYLSENCKELYCDKSMSIIKELGKVSKVYVETENDKIRVYELNKWRADKDNNTTTSVIPLERLFVIRSNLKQFLKKWGSEQGSEVSELSQLKSPEQFSRFKYLEGVEYASTATTIVGSALTLLNYPTAGGVITLVSPLVGTGASQLKTSLYDEQEKKWEEFKSDANIFLDNYNELLGILKKIETGKWGKVNLTLKNLKEKVNEFLKVYDNNYDEEIDIEELINERERFNEELDKIEEIVETIKELENKVIDYKQDKLLDKEEKVGEEKKVPMTDEQLFRKTISELSKQIQIDKEIKRKVKEKFKKKFSTTREIIFLLKGKENQFLVISQEKSNIFYNLFKWRSGSYLDLVEKGKKIKINKSNDFPKRFSSEEETIKEAVRIAEIELDEEQKELISKQAKKIIENKKVSTDIKGELEEKGWGKLIKELEKKLLEKEMEELHPEQQINVLSSNKNWWQWLKNCCGKAQDKNESSVKEQLSLDNSEKIKEVKELVESLESNQAEETQENYQVIDLDEHFEQKAQVEQPSK